jgi:hypothetical protein
MRIGDGEDAKPFGRSGTALTAATNDLPAECRRLGPRAISPSESRLEILLATCGLPQRVKGDFQDFLGLLAVLFNDSGWEREYIVVKGNS